MGFPRADILLRLAPFLTARKRYDPQNGSRISGQNAWPHNIAASARADSRELNL